MEEAGIQFCTFQLQRLFLDNLHLLVLTLTESSTLNVSADISYLSLPLKEYAYSHDIMYGDVLCNHYDKRNLCLYSLLYGSGGLVSRYIDSCCIGFEFFHSLQPMSVAVKCTQKCKTYLPHRWQNG
jgi:hypothetical protein